MRNASLCLATVLGAAIPAATARGAFIGPLDFETDGQVQYSNAPFSDGITVTVLDSTTTPADPFGPADNHSLMIEDASGNTVDGNGQTVSGSTAKADWFNNSDALTKGTFTGRLYTEGIGGSGNPYLSLRLGTNASSTLGDVGFSFTVSDTSISLAGVTVDNTWAVGTPHSVTIDFDVGANRVRGTLDGSPLKAGTTQVFAFNQTYLDSFTSVNAFEIIAGSTSNSNSRVIADDLTLAVPEPATMALLGLGGLGLLMRRRR